MLTELHVADGCETEARFCRTWLTAAAKLRRQMVAGGDGFDPLLYNETATVGLLVAAAGRAKLMALPEFVENGRKLPEGRVRAGRCDLWLASADWSIDWLIEFKLHWTAAGARSGFVRAMNAAVSDVFGRDRGESRERLACAVCIPYPCDTFVEADFARAFGRLSDFAKRVTLAYRMEGGQVPAFYFFQKIPRFARNKTRYMLES